MIADAGGDDDLQLDGLSAAELDALPYGVVEVDAEGRILAYNAAEARLSGLDPARVIGRDFFRDVAPCTHLPAFHGRFLRGVRRGRLDASFDFVFGFDPQPVRVRIAMRDAATPGRFWIIVRPLGVVAPTRQREASAIAAEAVDRRARAEPLDPAICEREPIHVPGAVQSHAAMIALDADTLRIDACSDNAAALFGHTATTLLEARVGDLFPPTIADAIADVAVGKRASDPTRPLRLRVDLDDAAHELTAHRNGDRVVVELERLPDRREDFDGATPLQAQDAIRRLRAADGLVAAAQACVDEVRAMTGFERVLAYRFDAEWNGEAIAEALAPDWAESLLGLRFPASDIPAQARALYTRSPARFVVDRDATPSTLVASPTGGNRPVDLSFAQSRALSPVHLEYQRNLGVNGSMSISIVVDDALWGLVIGHHRRPRYVEPDTRALATVVTEAFALRVQEIETAALWRTQQTHLAAQQKLFEQMAGSDDYVHALLDEATSLQELFACDGAAIVIDDGVRTIGAAPPDDAVRGIVGWLRAAPLAGARSFATDVLEQACPAAAPWRDVASGLLAACIDGERRHVLLWFRREIASAVAWGGDPTKTVLGDASRQVVLPRRSFERWIEERRGHAAPWEGWERGSAEGFAAGIEGVILRQSRRIAVLTDQQVELTAALAQKEVLAREVDHRVKNSLQIVAAVMLMQARKVDDPGARLALEETYARVMSVARVHDSLQQATDAETVEIGETLRLLCADLTGVASGGRSVVVTADEPLMVSSRTAVALSLIATELVTNALKYAFEPEAGGRVDVRVSSRGDGGLAMRVCDDGRGLPEGWEQRAERRGSGGLGMRIINAMLAQIEGRMEVGADDAAGACFTVVV